MVVRNRAFLLLLLSFYLANPAFAENNIIKIFAGKDVSEINKKVFGNNLLGYDTSLRYKNLRKKPYYGHADYGTGIWNPEAKETVSEVVELAKDAGISIVRFATENDYHWKETIGNGRRHFLYGIDEFMKTIEEIGAEPLLTISYFTGDEQDAADLVEYLNAPSDGEHQWADKRAANGHPEPYGVKYFEFSNEAWKGKRESPDKYAERYLMYQKAMKKVDPSIQLGASFYKWLSNWWDSNILKLAGSEIDFIVKHTYPPHDAGVYNLYKKTNKNDLFSAVLGSIHMNTEQYFPTALKRIKMITGRDDIYFAVNEYNGGFVQEKPVPYRHSLGAALVNAELLRVYMKAENKILMANNWHFINGYFGMIRSETNFMKHNYEKQIHYVKRPNYYVYELYNKHFGDILIDYKIKSTKYDIRKYRFFMKRFLKKVEQEKGSVIETNLFDTQIPNLSVNASRNIKGDKLYLMVVNKNMNEAEETIIELNDFNPSGNIKVWTLNGPSVEATNEKNKDNVYVSNKEYIFNGNSFKFLFEPHSLTAIEINAHD